VAWFKVDEVPGCTACAEIGRKGYCAPLRCYCGHESCWAFASWEPLPPRGALAPTPVTTRRNAWATREESTWIDKL